VSLTVLTRSDSRNAPLWRALIFLPSGKMAILVAVVVLEQFGAGLTQAQFNEVILAIFEDIPGFEALPHRRSRSLPKTPLVAVPPSHAVNRHRH
jgi:hypothetical protein